MPTNTHLMTCSKTPKHAHSHPNTPTYTQTRPPTPPNTPTYTQTHPLTPTYTSKHTHLHPNTPTHTHLHLQTRPFTHPLSHASILQHSLTKSQRCLSWLVSQLQQQRCAEDTGVTVNQPSVTSNCNCYITLQCHTNTYIHTYSTDHLKVAKSYRLHVVFSE